MGHKKIRRIDPLTMALPKGGVDSHAHLDGPEFDSDRAVVLERARAVGLAQIGCVFLNPEDFASRKAFFEADSDIFFLLGIHPCEGQRCNDENLAAMREAFNDARLKAVGEIGLDFHWKDCPREAQMLAFTAQLALARKLDRPVALHCREAEEQTLAILETLGFKDYPLLWHCFGGGLKLARRILTNGWHISVPGPVTYKGNAALREAVAAIPAERLLLETDCPYLAPEPWRGTRNEPANTVFTAHAAAAARGQSPEEVWQTCGDNARRFFGL
ncbi:MAG: TatD family hydrolase [Desulfovibrio sp.]|jgi:TatD DNase family protein|nr:TatD family hydrolase [Desulfovibrio sp.]